MIFALVGNQNCGKTTLFNALTGSNQHVGNFPGVTVDQKMGEMRDEKGCSVVDLPGIYSLRPYTQEEIVSRDFIINEKKVVWFIKTALEKALRTKRKSYMELKIVSSNKKIKRY